MLSKQRVDFLKRWYPDFYDHEVDSNFMKFLGNISAFIPLNTPVNHRLPRLMSAVSGSTAYTDLSDIFIPAEWLTYDYALTLSTLQDGHLKLPPSAIILVLLNGGVIHELGHILNSKELMERTKTARNYNSVFEAVVQTVEDIFLERWWAEYEPHISNFHTLLSELFFSGSTLHNYLNVRENRSVSPEREMKALIEALVSFKNPYVYQEALALEKSSIDLENMLLILETLTAKSTTSDRIFIMEKITEIFNANFSANAVGGVPDRIGDKEAAALDKLESTGQSGRRENQMRAARELMEQVNSAIGQFEMRDIERLLEQHVETAPQEIPEVVEADSGIARKRDRLDGTDLKESIHYESDIIDVDHRFLAFARALEMMRANKGGYEPLMESGKLNRRRLHRLATDGRIMQRRTAEDGDTRVDLEVVQLVDWSGSMNNMMHMTGIWGSDTTASDKSMSFRNAFTGAAIGAAMALTTNGIPNILFAHTTRYNHDKHIQMVVIPRLFSFKMATNAPSVTLSDLSAVVSLIAQDIYGKSNSDHLAIREVAKSFTRRRNTKVLIVYSDGLPTPVGYKFPQNIQITKAEIDRLRSMGIFVMSVSVTKEVWAHNDKIYGRQSNVKLSSQSDITREVSEVIKRLSVKG